ncbi:MAG: heterodisulfide reductase-related iron-sulfur binding cluster [bacterium JZ-2024 1]
MKLTLTILLAISASIFVGRVVYLVQNIRRSKPEFCFDRPIYRILTAVWLLFSQAPVVKEPGGIGHFFIFWGFVVISVGTLEGFIRLYREGFSFVDWFGSSPTYALYVVQDILVVTVWVALSVSLIRYMFLRPRRIYAGKHIPKSLFFAAPAIMLASLLLLLDRVTDVQHPFFGDFAQPSFASLPVSRWFVTPDLLPYHDAFFFFHNVLILVLLAYIPFFKHLHILGAPFNILFRKLNNNDRYRLPELALDLASANTDQDGKKYFGVKYLRDYTWKRLLDHYACSSCGHCQVNCPAFLTGKLLSPRLFVENLRDRLTRGYTGKLIPDVVHPDEFWACTACGACVYVCPTLNEPMQGLLELRRYVALSEPTALPEGAVTLIRNLQKFSNPWGLPPAQSGALLKERNYPHFKESSPEYLFWLGCWGRLNDRSQKVALVLSNLLERAGVSFGFLYEEENCSGDPARRLGNELLFNKLKASNIKSFQKYGVTKVITMCPHCYQVFRHEYGQSIPVFHHTEILAQLITEGRLKPDTLQSEPLTYHDSCYLSRYNSIVQSPREVLKAITEAPLVEMKHCRQRTLCCGAGGGQMFLEEKGTRMNVNRINEAVKAGARQVAVACPFCLQMLGDAAAQLETQITVQDISELLSKAFSDAYRA